jgi:serine/threonine protein kinase
MGYTAGVAAGEDADEKSKAHTSSQELLGKKVGGKYLIEKILGRGGMGTIYVAEQQPLGRKVALKVLHPTLGGGEADPEFAKRFLLEAATLSKLAHPNIVVVHDYGSLEDEHASCFMVMELLDGRTINQVLNETKIFDAQRTLRISREIARALRAAHELGVIHRDLKPANVMLVKGPDGEIVKVLDFGLVKVVRDDQEELTAEGRFLGSPRYMSPEQIQRLPMDGRADLYSLGVIMYRMLCGEVPFAGDHAVQTLMAHLANAVPRMEDHTGVRVHPAVEQIVMTLLEKDPNKRYANAETLIRAIDEAWAYLSPDPLSMSGEHMRPSALRSGEHDPPSLVTPPSGAMRYSFPAGIGAPSGTSAIITGSNPALPPLPPLTADMPAQQAPAKRWPLIAVVILGIAAGLGGAAAVTMFAGEEEERPDPPIAQAPVQQEDPRPEGTDVVQPDARPDPQVPPVAAESTFTLNIRSDPNGATIYRDGVEAGVTPMSFELDSEALGRQPITFVLRARGRGPVSFVQGPSEGDVTIDRQLPRLGGVRPRVDPEPTNERPRGGDLSIKTAR